MREKTRSHPAWRGTFHFLSIQERIYKSAICYNGNNTMAPWIIYSFSGIIRNLFPSPVFLSALIFFFPFLFHFTRAAYSISFQQRNNSSERLSSSSNCVYCRFVFSFLFLAGRTIRPQSANDTEKRRNLCGRVVYFLSFPLCSWHLTRIWPKHGAVLPLSYCTHSVYLLLTSTTVTDVKSWPAPWERTVYISSEIRKHWISTLQFGTLSPSPQSWWHSIRKRWDGGGSYNSLWNALYNAFKSPRIVV